MKFGGKAIWAGVRLELWPLLLGWQNCEFWESSLPNSCRVRNAIQSSVPAVWPVMEWWLAPERRWIRPWSVRKPHTIYFE